MELIQRYSKCFVCGDKNDMCLKVDFFHDGEKARAEYHPTPRFEGYKEILHGGIISALLDEVMIKAIIAKGIFSLTSRIDIRFKNFARIGEKLLLEGRIKEDRRRLILAEGKAFKQEGEVIAAARGTYFRVKGQIKEQLERSID
ncbi:MAG: PaaI family thioesterase [Candidatus Aminicenantes bacterium]|nr:MAG: PaaI family thioesterase [Candidatus Aminicenantes bacterium]